MIKAIEPLCGPENGDIGKGEARDIAYSDLGGPNQVRRNVETLDRAARSGGGMARVVAPPPAPISAIRDPQAIGEVQRSD